MRKIFNKSAVLILLGCASLEASAQIKKSQLAGQVNTITTAVPFLLIGPDSRAGGMGDVGAATTPDANSIHWNPAKLAFIDKDFGASISYTPWLRALVNDINLAYVSGYKRINKRQAFGMSLLYFSLGNITFTDEQAQVVANYNPNEFAIDGSFAQQFSDDFSGGVSLRYIRSDLGKAASSADDFHAGSAVAADASAYYRKSLDVSKKASFLSFGAVISNLGTKISYSNSGNRDFIPTNLRLGTSLMTELDKYNTIAVSLDFNKLLVPTPDTSRKNSDISVAKGVFSSFTDAPGGFSEEIKEFIYSGGLEYWYDKQFAVRAGYFHEAATKGNRQYATLGAGIRYNVFGLDFAYVIPTSAQRSPLENTLRFTLLFDLDGNKGAPKTEQ